MIGGHIAVSGLPGSGKSTLVAKLAKEFGWIALQERFESNPYLGRFYREPSTWALKNYLYFVTESLYDLSATLNTSRGVIQERPPQEHLLVFGREFFARAYIDESDYRTLERLNDAIQRALPRPDLLIYLDVSPEVAFQRMELRGHPAETYVSIDYLRGLHARYPGLLKAWDGSILTIDSIQVDFRDDTHLDGVAERIRSILDSDREAD